MSGRACTVCAHPLRDEIDQQIADGRVSIRSISRQHGVSLDALLRHRDSGHIPPPRVAAAIAADMDHGVGLVRSASELRDKAMALLARAEEDGDLRTALAGVREAARCLELVAKMTGLIDNSVTVNVAMSAEFVQIRTTILSALAPHPEARADVVAALARIS